MQYIFLDKTGALYNRESQPQSWAFILIVAVPFVLSSCDLGIEVVLCDLCVTSVVIVNIANDSFCSVMLQVFLKDKTRLFTIKLNML